MRLAAICVVLGTCTTLIVMVICQAVGDLRRQRVRRVLEERLAPYEVTKVTHFVPDKVIDLREPEPTWQEQAWDYATGRR